MSCWALSWAWIAPDKVQPLSFDHAVDLCNVIAQHVGAMRQCLTSVYPLGVLLCTG
jgi:hypothetical protein